MTKFMWAACVAGLFVCVPAAVRADATYHSLASGNFSQDWSDASLITTSDDWSGVPSIIGYRGDGLAATTADPQTVLGEGTPVIDVNANQTNPNTFNTGGVTEFEITNPTIALSGSGTARAPNIVIHLDTTGRANVVIAYVLRDIDSSTASSVQPYALQYRVGTMGAFINLPGGFTADATTGPSLADALTSISVTLPADAWNQPQVQVRIITTDATGADERVGIDDILVTSTGGTVATLDFGDAPASYDDPVAASHDTTALDSPRLGALVDAESGPQSSADASGDGADEDGVTLPVAFTRGSTISIPVFGESPGAGYELIAYFDWDRDGEFDGFEVLDDTITGSFTANLVVTVPSTAALGTTFARFRIATSLSLDPDGAEADGEVEDYEIAVVAACGDGVVDTGEACDDAGATDACGCLPDCSGFAPSTTVCGAAGDACDPADLCDGAGLCVTNVAPMGTSCRASAGDCDLPEVCDGTAPTCPADTLRSSVALCRASAGDCDVAEFCTGASAACPADALRSSAFECRASAGTCDAAESCDGATVACPADGFAPDGTTCSDGSLCTGSDVCSGGVCAGTSVDCGDSDVCTADACDPVTGCSHTFITGCCTIAADCFDGTACTTDVCDPSTNRCANTALDCNDSDACTVDSCSPASGCANVALSCDDGNACTVDACDVVTGCSNTAIAGCCLTGADCGDGDACTTDTCDPSTNTCSNTARSCDDGNACTADACDGVTGCSNTAITGCCLIDSDCSDGNACTDDACNPATNTCSNLAIDCDDGDVCTADACSAGACTHDLEPVCFDAGTPDAGIEEDAGLEEDAGIVDEDAGLEEDAGIVEEDAGIAGDAGTDDAGIEDDAGLPEEDAGIVDVDAALGDTGPSDTGPGDSGLGDTGPRDVGPLDASPDAGAPVIEMGCGCRAQGAGGSSTWPLAALALLGLVIARRRR